MSRSSMTCTPRTFGKWRAEPSTTGRVRSGLGEGAFAEVSSRNSLAPKAVIVRAGVRCPATVSRRIASAPRA